MPDFTVGWTFFLTLILYPGVMAYANSDVKVKDGSFEEMLKSGLHFGYSKRSRHPKTQSYLYGTKNGVDIFDLEKVKKSLDEAKAFVKGLAEDGKTVLFVGTKPEIRDIVRQAAERIKMPYCAERWLGGTLTNFKVIRKRLDYFEELKESKKTGGWEKYTKKERLEKDKETERMSKFFTGIENLKKIPDAIVIVDTKKERAAVKEAEMLSVPIIGLLNSDCNPADANYPVIANDSSRLSVEFFINKIVDAYEGSNKGA